MAKKRIRIGLIGCGSNMRYAHVPRLKADGAVELIALIEPVRARAEALMETWGCEVPWYTDYRAMIRNEQLDAVVISTPHAVHYEQTSYAMRQGLHA